jgi:hypothetical protein
MTWQEANGSWNVLTLAKGIFPLTGSASVSAHPFQELGFAACGRTVGELFMCCRKPIIHCTVQWYFWRIQLWSDATRVMRPDSLVRF